MRTEPICLSALGRGFLFSSLVLLASACGDLATAPALAAAEDRVPSSPPALPVVSPLAGVRFHVDPGSSARRQVEAWRASRPEDAAALERIASQPQAIWLGDWTPQPYDQVRRTTRAIVQRGEIPVYVLYNIPSRDCGLHSRGGAVSAAAYRSWISDVARGIGSDRAVVILEPDALASVECLSGAEQEARLQMIREAVRALKEAAGVSVYIDAGNPRWRTAEVMAQRLLRAGVQESDGFSLNVSNFIGTEENIRYGAEISRRVGEKRFVIDTSRNGNGPGDPSDWCNPRGRALGAQPTASTGHPLVDAFLWIKSPGESDGECNGGPRAGEWWADYALMLARNAGT